tara:strand:+ start:500 stop:1102 length:603 start_codon:yes stop_codon:yes gene_type:complete
MAKKRGIQTGSEVEGISKDTLVQMAKKNIWVNKNNNKVDLLERYSIKNERAYLGFSRGFDLLENLHVVRKYIQKKHSVDLKELEILLKLYPMQYFTQRDYVAIPKPFKFRSIKNGLDKGLVEKVNIGEHLGKTIYTISNKKKRIVREFYKMLSGEMKIPEDWNRHFRYKNLNAYDKKALKLIKKINSQEKSEFKKSLYGE